MKLILTTAITASIMLCSSAFAHFQMIHLPEGALPESPPEQTITLLFGHPFDGGTVMDMGKGLDGKPTAPVEFGVMHRGQKVNLLEYLKPISYGPADYKHQGFRTPFQFKGMGDFVFYCDPGYYWEAGEDTFIRHYTKTIVNHVGQATDWKNPVGFPVEIMPLVKPYALWAGNVFSGRVVKLVNGAPQPVADTIVEVEYLNYTVGDEAFTGAPKLKAPNGAFSTQQLRTDDKGEFTYGLPVAGWWGFAALVDGDEKMKGPDGEDKDVEAGGLLWVWAADPNAK
jgi:cobalt/nickel transport protein